MEKRFSSKEHPCNGDSKRDNLSLDFFVVDPMLHVTLSFPAKPRTEYHGSNLLSCRATLTVMENPTMEVWGGRSSQSL